MAALEDAPAAAHLARSEELARAGDREQAMLAAYAAAKVAPNDPAVQHDLALRISQFGDHDEAARIADEAIRLAPDDPEMHRLAGAIALERRAWKEAEQHFRVLVAANPEDEAALNDLGVALNAQGRWKEGVPLLEAAARSDPRFEEPRMNLFGGVRMHFEAGTILVVLGSLGAFAAAWALTGDMPALLWPAITVFFLAKYVRDRTLRRQAMSPHVREAYARRRWGRPDHR